MLFVVFIILLSLNTLITPKTPFVAVQFNQSMAQTPHYIPAKARTEKSWQQAEQLFDEHILNNMSYQEIPRIPKIIHQIWLGSPLPKKCIVLRNSWIKHHPDWQYILWTDKDIEAFNLINKERYTKAKNYGEKSDIARYEILERFGGLYIDTDFECLTAFDTLHHCCDFYAGLNCETGFEVFNGLIASRPEHPILKGCIRQIAQQSTKNNLNDPMSILARTGPYFFTSCILQSLAQSQDAIVLFPTSYFYPWPYYARHLSSQKEIEAWIKPETMAIHHWHCSWTHKKS